MSDKKAKEMKTDNLLFTGGPILTMAEKMEKISLIIIEHDMSVISDVTDRVLVFNAGQEIAKGKFSEVSNNPEVRAAYIGGGE